MTPADPNEHVPWSHPPSPEDLAWTADAMIGCAGLTPSLQERQALRETYAGIHSALAALYAVPDVSHEPPALAFQAEPKLTRWETDATRE